MRRPSAWSADELASFLAEARGGRLEAAWMLAAVTDLRVGELLALRWRDVDLDRGELQVRHAVVGVPHEAIKQPTEARRIRTVRLDPLAALLLRMHRDQQRIARSEWSPDHRGEDLVICHEDGRPLHPRRLQAAFTRIADRAGVRLISLPSIRRTGLGGRVEPVVPQ